jgi:hypothetical protein
LKRTIAKGKFSKLCFVHVLISAWAVSNAFVFAGASYAADAPVNGAASPVQKPSATGGLKTTGTWHLKQTCAVLGDQDVIVSSKGIKIVDHSIGLTTVASAPDWIVTTYDTKSKTYSQVPIKSQKTYIPDKEFKVLGIRWQNLALDKEVALTDVARVQAQGYVTPNSFSEKQFKDRQRESADMQFVVSAKHCEATSLSVPKEAAQILSTYYSLPSKGAVPVQFRYHDLGGNFHNWLVTSNIQPADPVDYKPPIAPGFQNLPPHSISEQRHKKAPKQKSRRRKFLCCNHGINDRDSFLRAGN